MSKFHLERTSGGRVDEAELVEDLRRVAKERGSNTVGMNDYRVCGAYSDTTVARRFGSWNEALKAAGLSLANEIEENLRTLCSACNLGKGALNDD